MFISVLEKKFLVALMVLSFFSMGSTSIAVITEVIYGGGSYVCILTETKTCFTAYFSTTALDLVFYGVRLDVLLSAITFSAATSFAVLGMFNARILIGFISLLSLKTVISFTITSVILTSSNYYFDTLLATINAFVTGNEVQDVDRLNTCYTLIFVISSIISTAFALIVSVCEGCRMVRKYEEKHNDAVWAKWDQMTADLVAY